MINIFERIFSEYVDASGEPFTQHALANYIRKTAPESMQKSIGESASNLLVKGSCGQSQWADIPWIALLDPLVTSSTLKGYYIVYLFASDMSRCYLCLGQGVTAVEEEFGSKQSPQVLKQRAGLIRARIPSFKNNFSAVEIQLNASSALGKKYGPGAAFSKVYQADKLPGNSVLVSDLQEMISLYDQLTYQGGVDLVENEIDEVEVIQSMQVEEKKRFKEHRRIEGRINTQKVKKILGCVCSVCDFNFSETYGDLGDGYIEAHHLQPYSDLLPGEKRKLHLKNDFAVLCANCHRMIHRLDDPSDIDGLRKLIKS